MAPTDLSEPERLLWQAFPRGAWIDLRTGDPAGDDPQGGSRWGPERVIRAEVIRALLLGAGEAEPGQVPAVRLRGARITGRLDLMGATVAHALVCDYCRFTEMIRLVDSSAGTVRIHGSLLPGLNAARMRLSGILDLRGSRIEGMIKLDHARVDGLCLSRAEIGADGTTAAVTASGLSVDGEFEGVALRAEGPVLLENATVAGGVDLSEARITAPGQRALIMSRAVMGRLDARGIAVAGETRMHNTRIGASMVLAGARLDNPGDVALSAGGLSVAGGVFLADNFAANGEIRLYGASLEANLTATGAALRNPGGVALTLDRATLGVLRGEDLVAEGQVSLSGARVTSDVDLRGARLSGHGDQAALAADGASIDGMLYLQGLVADGEVRLRTIRVGQRILLMAARLANPGDTALRLSRALVGADVFCEGMTVTGGVRAPGATIGGELDFDGARICNGPGTALQARSLEANLLSLRFAEPPEGLVDLGHARARIIRDDPASWAGRLSVDGLSYDALEPRLPARRRLEWLARDPDGHTPLPYEQLAAYFTAIGQPDQARRVMYASERILRRGKSPLSRAWGLVQDVTIGYGYQPWRAVAWLVLLLLAGSITFAVQPPPPLQAGDTPHFNPVVYTLDLLLPVVDLGQKHAFNPGGAEQWLSYVLIAAGWLLVTTVAAGAARVLSRR
ncbi:hypothetical protein EAS64_03440 [Trebonia kvetii]|uniref:Oxidoreductase n=1 Tax=Trebonia kvetii TaxID=2480626 RepID=A0A6P2C835_9ACTN|nr:hypothetical protein [Trebonia kvetii]TVZ06486.1 hypothetical protein EAS64_03440 [Trebonia kvetii]